jgi:hypothetical protein
MEVSSCGDSEKIKRLQNYAKLFAPSLRFLECRIYFNKGEYHYRYSINVEEQNLIDEFEYKICEREENEKREKAKKQKWYRKIFDCFNRSK